jgi:hypothetical protein
MISHQLKIRHQNKLKPKPKKCKPLIRGATTRKHHTKIHQTQNPLAKKLNFATDFLT